MITAPAPEDLRSAKTSYLELRLVVTDARGLKTTLIRNVLPKLVKVSFATLQSGLKLNIDGVGVRTPKTFTSWEGFQFPIGAPTQTDTSGRQYVFKSWSDGGAKTHVITTPATARTYTAIFR